MTFPIIPQAPGIVIQVGARNAAALERRQCFAAIKAGGVIHKGQQAFWHTQIRHDGIAYAAHRPQCHQSFFDGLWNKAEQRCIDKQIHPGRMCRLAENIEHIAHAVTHRVYQMEAFTTGVFMMADVVKRINHEINRHDIDSASLQPHHRHP